jgi:hypothetical protein
MKANRYQINVASAAAITFIVSVAGCGAIGETGSIKNANELAIACKTDEALAALDRAEAGGGLGSYLAGLERVGILRDAGRSSEADIALQRYLERPETESTSRSETEQSIDEFVSKLREARREETGQAVCPR